MTDMSLWNDLSPDNHAGMQDFLLANSLSHTQVATALEQRGKGIQSFPLNDVGNMETWLETHAQVHAQEFSAIGLTGLPDLQDVDLQDKEQMGDWMLLHSAVHLAVNQALGMTA